MAMNPVQPIAVTALAAAFALASAPLTSRAAEDILVLTSDFSSGALSTLPLSQPCNATIDRASICGDAVARTWGDRIYVVNRFGCDSIQLIDPFHGYATVAECSVGNGSNPQDVAVVSPTRVYVSRYESNWLLEVNPSTCARTDSISLAAFADVDGTVEMHRMMLRGNRLYVELQRLDRRSFTYVPVTPSYLAVIDVTTRQLVDVDPVAPGVQAIALQGTNPVAPMQIELTTGLLLVPEAGEYGLLNDGGIERVDLRTNRSVGFALSGAALQGDIIDFTQGLGARGYVLRSDASFNTSLMRYDSISGTLGSAVYAPGGYVLSDCLAYAGKLYLTDRDFFDPGVRVFDLATEAPLCGGVVPTGLPPFELLVRPDSPSAVTDAALFRSAPWPNPSRGEVHLALAAGGAMGPGSEGITLRVVAPDGRLVRRLALQGGWAEAEWDGNDERALPVPSGVYLLEAIDPAGRRDSRTVRILR